MVVWVAAVATARGHGIGKICQPGIGRIRVPGGGADGRMVPAAIVRAVRAERYRPAINVNRTRRRQVSTRRKGGDEIDVAFRRDRGAVESSRDCTGARSV